MNNAKDAWAVEAIAWFVAFAHAHERSDHKTAADALKRLAELGITVKIGKGARRGK